MKQLTVISGKGGTGKTTITASLAFLEEAVVADCDVDAPDLHLILTPEIKGRKVYSDLKVAVVDKETCTECGECREHCRFNAINEDININESCEGCGVCAYVCPVKAIRLQQRDSGEIFSSSTRVGPMAHALLYTAEEASGKLVTMVRNEATYLAEKYGRSMIIIDGPPGIGCSVIASMSGVDAVLIVTEPTVSGIHDMARVLQVTKHFGIRAMVCINKYDMNEEKAWEIEQYCHGEGIAVVGKLPYSRTATDAMIDVKAVVEYKNDELSEEIKNMWEKMRCMI